MSDRPLNIRGQRPRGELWGPRGQVPGAGRSAETDGTQRGWKPMQAVGAALPAPAPGNLRGGSFCKLEPFSCIVSIWNTLPHNYPFSTSNLSQVDPPAGKNPPVFLFSLAELSSGLEVCAPARSPWGGASVSPRGPRVHTPPVHCRHLTAARMPHNRTSGV